MLKRLVLFSVMLPILAGLYIVSSEIVGGGQIDSRLLGKKAEKVLVLKKARHLIVFADGKPLKKYRISLGFNPTGHKQQEGDGKTPEGNYVIDFRKEDSVAYRALHISYPNNQDRARARQQGVSPGGAIMIHGMLNGYAWFGLFHLFVDWTAGCIAVRNGEMDELMYLIDDGTPIEIRS